MLSAGLAKAGVRLIGIYSRPIFEPEFNRLLDEHDSKGSLLSHATLRLAAEVLASLPAGSIHVLCDKHGGRNRYAARPLSDAFPGSFIEVRAEGCEQSVYRFGPPNTPRGVPFPSQGRIAPAGRIGLDGLEVPPRIGHGRIEFLLVPCAAGLLETAGYPLDAKRFKAQIAPVQAELGIDDRSVCASKVAREQRK